MNMSILKMVVLIIGATLLMSIAGIIYLVTQERTIPDILQIVVASSISGLLGLLAPSHAAQDPNT